MADVTHRRADLAGHPDIYEMRNRYERVLHGRDVVLVDAPVFLAGLYCAISPWVVNNFATAQPNLVVHNLIVGVALGLIALGFTLTPERVYGMSWALCAIGAWMFATPWWVGSFPDAGIIWNQFLIGGVVFVLGVAAIAQSMAVRRRQEA
ncbi:SPW repeat protein [Streptomyces aidingensis]|uniref:SPW repeat-containing protein n=1 Tax=Streptomyces aidingensis TaxID=910347 RepID=A0A1I1LDA6_9ACTN|nr:SPW repeat protein [Streptomyces aidingensis]SFC71009.1 SPW repeat-containing protein [Streptomyces aidingensis]